MITNAQLLELMLREYHANSIMYRVRGDSSVIKEATVYLQRLIADEAATTAVIDKLLVTFRPLLAKWNISKEPPATLKVLPVLINSIIKSLAGLEGFESNLSLMDIYRKEWFQQFVYFSASVDIMDQDTLYFHKDLSKFYVLLKNSEQKNVVLELINETQCLQQDKETMDAIVHKIANENSTALTSGEVKFLMRKIAEKGYFLPPKQHQNGDGKKYCAELLLISAGISLAPALKEILQEYGMKEGYMIVAKRIIVLNNAQKLTTLVNILEKHFKSRKPFGVREVIFKSYWQLFAKGFLTNENEACLSKVLSPSFLDQEHKFETAARTFRKLESSHDLTDADKALIASVDGYQAREILSILEELKSVDLLTEEYKDICLRTVPGHQSVQDTRRNFNRYICHGIAHLKKADLLTEENQRAVEQAATNGILCAAEHVAKILVFLNKMRRLTPEARVEYSSEECLKKTSKNNEVFYLLERLDRLNLLAENFDFVLNNAKLLTKTELMQEGSVKESLEKIPDHMLTQAVLNEIARIVIRHTDEQTGLRIEQADQAIQNYLTGLLRPVNPAPVNPNQIPVEGLYEWGAGQTAHTPSIELSSTLALLSLEKRYHLTPIDIARCIGELRLFRDTIHTEPFARLDTENLDENIRDSAERCLTRLIELALTQSSQEESTHFAFDKILALVWTGLGDSASRRPDTDLDPIENFIRELRNIQVIYGISNAGMELSSCFGGTIKGLLNSINGIHPDVNLDLINRDTVYSLMRLQAKAIFEQSFCEKIREPGFLEKINQEIEALNWKDNELQLWYETCVQSAAQVVEKECLSRMQQTGLDKEQIDEFMEKWVQKLWIPAIKVGISYGKPMLDDFNASRALANFTADEINLLLSTITNTVLKNCIQGLICNDNGTFVFTTNSENEPKYKNEFFTQVDVQQIQSALAKLDNQGNVLNTKLLLKKRYEEMVESIRIPDSISHHQQCAQQYPELLESVRLEPENGPTAKLVRPNDSAPEARKEPCIDAKLIELRRIVKEATQKYINFHQAKNSSLDSPRGFCGGFISSGLEQGITCAKLLQGKVESAGTAKDAQQYINQFLNGDNQLEGEYDRHFFASFLIKELVTLENSPWAELKNRP